MEHKLYERATIDGLTGIYNRQKCIEHIDMELDRYKRYNSGFALIMLDIDDFKNVNDTHGHDVGDDVLKELSRIVSQKIRKSDIFSRWGGEEFMIVAPDLTEDEAVFFSEKLREEIGLINFEKIGRITASFGITFPKQDETKDELLKRVDKALYISKANGKNKIHTL